MNSISSVSLDFEHSYHFRCGWCFCMLLFYWRSGDVLKNSVNFVMWSWHPCHYFSYSALSFDFCVRLPIKIHSFLLQFWLWYCLKVGGPTRFWFVILWTDLTVNFLSTDEMYQNCSFHFCFLEYIMVYPTWAWLIYLYVETDQSELEIKFSHNFDRFLQVWPLTIVYLNKYFNGKLEEP